MSKLLDCDSSADCKRWQAPQLRKSAPAGSGMRTRKQQVQNEQDAYQQGFTQGYNEGLEQGQKEISEHIAYLQSLMTTLSPLRHSTP